MDIKNAVAVCLISLFSATIVVLIARSLDLHVASQLEPSLSKIAAELEAIRKQGGGLTVSADAAPELREGLVVYYFHGKQRCPSCRAIESQAYDVLEKDFAEPLAEGKIVWEVVNYEKPSSAPLAKAFDVQMAVVVLARMNEGRIERWKRLDEVWGLYDDPPAFAKFVRAEVAAMLPAPDADAESASRPGHSMAGAADRREPQPMSPSRDEAPAAGTPLPNIPIPD